MPRVLIVDDEEDFRSMLGLYLAARGVEVELADGAAQARERMKHSRFDLVISDFNMPGETGLDLFRYILDRYPGLPFFLMSGFFDQRARREALAMGISGYILKPFPMLSLMLIIQEHASAARNSVAVC